MKKLFFCLLTMVAINATAQNEVTLANGQRLSQHIVESEKNIYILPMQKDGYFECDINQLGVDVAIDLLTPGGNKLETFDSPNGDEGKEHITLKASEKGNYKLQVYMLEAAEEVGPKRREKPGNYTITNVKILTATEYSQQQQQEKRQLNAAKEWIGENAHPLKSVTAGNNFDDLKWMKSAIGDAKYVGVGEATHGTKEYFQLKHRIFEFLVKEMGFNTFAIEASYAGCKNINDYIQSGKGTAAAALASQGFWTWDTEEVLELIEWMRKYNTTAPQDKKLSFIGIDVQNNVIGGGTAHVSSYLKKVAPALASQGDSIFTALAKIEKRQMSDTNALKYRKAFTALKRNVQKQRDTLLKKSTRQEYDNAMGYMNNIDKYFAAFVYRGKTPTKQESELRDKFMAENFRNYISQNRDAKIMLWAHNNHIDKNPAHEVNGGERPLGSYLRNAYGNNYYAMGFLLGKGSFHAMGQIDSVKSGLQEFTVNDPKENSLEWVMQQTGNKRFIVNFRGVQDLPADVKAATERDFLTRQFGSFAVKNFTDDMYTTPLVISKEFDALIFIDNTTAARPLKTKP